MFFRESYNLIFFITLVQESMIFIPVNIKKPKNLMPKHVSHFLQPSILKKWIKKYLYSEK